MLLLGWWAESKGLMSSGSIVTPRSCRWRHTMILLEMLNSTYCSWCAVCLYWPSNDQVEDLEVPGDEGTIPVRVYRPESEGLLPIMVYYHGGGWCFCSIDSHDSVCRSYATACNAVVVSVGYRLAPEYPFPAGLNDCYAATAWVSIYMKHYHCRCECASPRLLLGS